MCVSEGQRGFVSNHTTAGTIIPGREKRGTAVLVKQGTREQGGAWVCTILEFCLRQED